MSFKFLCRCCFKYYESESLKPSCSNCNNHPEENYRLDSPIVNYFLHVMNRSDPLEAMQEVLSTDLRFAEELRKLNQDSCMAGWICPRDRHFIEQVLINYPRKNPVVLEIGVAGGGCSNTMLIARPDCTFYGIDNWSANEAYKTDFFNMTKPFMDRVTMITGDSRIIGPEWNKPLDVLLIDGGHEYEVASADIANFVPWVKKGGMVMLDDYNSPQVKRAVGEYFNSGFNVIRIPDSSFGMAEKLIVYRKEKNG